MAQVARVRFLNVTIRRICKKKKELKVDVLSITSIVSDDLEQSTGGHEQGIITQPKVKDSKHLIAKMPTLEELKEQASKEGTTVKEVAKCLLKNIAILHLEASSDSDLEKYHQALNEAFPHAKGLLKPVIPPEVKEAKELDPYIETLMGQLFEEQLPTPKETPRAPHAKSLIF